MSERVRSVEAVVLQEVANILRPLELLAAPEEVTALLRELGWDFTSPFPRAFPDLANDLENLTNALYAVDEATDAGEQLRRTADLLAQVRASISSIGNLPAQMHQSLTAYAGFRDASALEHELFRRLLDYLVVGYLSENRRTVHDVALLLGLIEYVQLPADPTRYRLATRLKRFAWERIRKVVTDPAGVAEDVYHWQSNLDAEVFLSRLVRVAMDFGFFGVIVEQDPRARAALDRQPNDENELRLPFFQSGTLPGAYVEGGLRLSSAPGRGNEQKGLAIFPYLVGEAGARTERVHGFQVEFASSVALENGVVFFLRPPSNLSVQSDLLTSPTVPNSIGFTLKLTKVPAPGDVLVLLGLPNRSCLITEGGISLGFSAQKMGGSHELAVEVEIKRVSLAVAREDGDGFLQKVLPPEGPRTEVDLGLGWSSKKGLYFLGSTGLEATLPVHESILGVLYIDSVYLAIRAVEDGLAVVCGLTTGIKLGPLTATVERFGLQADIGFPPGGGNLGVADVALGFKPPDGAGLRIDAGAIVGGGYLFFDVAKQEYAGILQLEFQETISLAAIGLLTTKMLDGSKGFSLLVIISAEDFTPIQLGYGFTLNGIGGLLGVNRTVVVDVLRAGIKNRTLDSVLFPEDPVRNAPQIISNLRAVFPPAENRYVFGPMAIIGWGTPTMVTIELGIVLEFPAPVRLVIFGQVRAFLPDPLAPLITLQMDALGVIDFDKGDASVDATLYDSRLIQYVLTGDMALRANWGASPTFVLAVGGLHPRFQPPPAFPKLDRIAVSLATGDNPRLRLETYLALTSNTAQIGARLELYAKEGGFNIEGWVGFDALFQFEPFQFVADVGGRVVVRRGGNKITSVGLDMTLTGPKPWHARGKAKFEVLSIKHSVRFDARFGQEEERPLPVAVDVTKLLVEAARDVRNWSGQLPQNGHPLVSVRPSGDSASLLVHPQGELVFRQRVAPLNLTISRFGNTTPSGERSFALREVKVNGIEVKPTPVTEYFAPAQFFEMSDDEKLSRPSFEPLEAGIRLGTNITHCEQPVWTPIKYETIIVDPKKAGPGEPPEDYPLPAKHLPALALLGAAGRAAFRRTGRGKYRAAGPRIAVGDGVYVVATTDKLKKESIPGLDEGEAFSYTKAADALRNFLAAHPEQRGSLQIVRDMRGRQDA